MTSPSSSRWRSENYRATTCDTNVLVSAFIVAEPPSRVLEEVIDARLELVLPQPVMVELKRILTGRPSR